MMTCPTLFMVSSLVPPSLQAMNAPGSKDKAHWYKSGGRREFVAKFAPDSLSSWLGRDHKSVDMRTLVGGKFFEVDEIERHVQVRCCYGRGDYAEISCFGMQNRLN